LKKFEKSLKMSDFEINGTPVHKLRVVDLKEELDSRGLSKSGKKDELVARLVSFLEAEAKNEEKTGEVEEGSNDSKDEMMKKWQEEREQLLKENEVKRQEEEKAKEEEDSKKLEEEKKKQEEERKRLEDEKMKETEKAEKAAEAARLKEEKERKLAEELRLKDEAKRKAEEEKKLAAEKKEEEKRKIAEEKRKAEEEEKALLKKRKEEELEAKELKRKEKEKLEDELRKSHEEKLKKSHEEKSEEEEKTKEDSALGDNNKEDESLILETAADDTLVMEIEQADIVTDDKEEQEKENEAEIPSEPGQVTSLRRLGSRSGAGADDRKRGWGSSKVTNGGAAPVSISSDSLKDIVPDLKPLLDTTEPAISDEQGEIQSVDSDPDVAGPKVPESVKNEKDEPVKKKKKIVLTEDDNESEFVIITQLTRPFTVKAFQEMLKRTGTLEDFWIDKIKSTCIVKFSSADQASETKMALDGVTWPVGNPRTLRVAFSSQEMMNKYKQNAEVGLKSSGDAGDRLSGLREWDKNKSDEREERRGEHERERRNDREVRIRERSRERPPPTKSLEELFQKTTAMPAIYWKPLSEEQIQQKIDARKKKLMEAKILKEMEDTKETLQKSQKLISSRRKSHSRRSASSSSSSED